MKKTIITLVAMIVLTSLVSAALDQTIDGFVYYEGDVPVEAGIPVYRYYVDHDTYHYTTTGQALDYRLENSSNYYNYYMPVSCNPPQPLCGGGNNTQWQIVWTCNATHYGKIEFGLNNLQHCASGDCKDIVINQSVLGEPLLDHENDGFCMFFDNCWNVYNPRQADYDNDGLGDACDTPYCNGIEANNSAVCSGNGDCISIDNCVCDLGWQGADCSTMDVTINLGDANNDGVVSAGDYASVQANFGTVCEIPCCDGDANCDGVVSAGDYASVQANFGNVYLSALEPVKKLKKDKKPKKKLIGKGRYWDFWDYL